MQVVQPPVGCREGEAALFRGDRHRGGGTARDQFGPQPGQPVQHVVRELIVCQQLSDLGDTIGERPRYLHHGRAPYPAAPQSCACGAPPCRDT